MLDIKFVRNNPDVVKENIKKKFQDEKLPLVDEVLELDKRNREIKQEVEALRAERNKISKEIGACMAQGKKEEAEELKKQVQANADRVESLSAEEKEVEAKIKKNMMTIPNIIDPSVPIGKDDTRMWRSRSSASLLCRSLRSPTTQISWRALTASIWRAPEEWQETDSTT